MRDGEDPVFPGKSVHNETGPCTDGLPRTVVVLGRSWAARDSPYSEYLRPAQNPRIVVAASGGRNWPRYQLGPVRAGAVSPRTDGTASTHMTSSAITAAAPNKVVRAPIKAAMGPATA